MAFVKKTWKDRISDYPNRRVIDDGIISKVVTVSRAEGSVTEEGDSFSAANMNDLEQRIFNATQGGGGGGASALTELSDVNISDVQNGETLVYDETSEKWVNGQGGGKQTALTQAEYDALVQAGTVDPTMEYFITDGIPASVKYYHNYSTDEQVVGTWIDGSTLYEKTIHWTGTCSSNGGSAILDNTLFRDNVNYFAVVLSSVKSNDLENNIYSYSLGGDCLEYTINNQNGVLIENYSRFALHQVDLTIRYTKAST